MPPATYALYLTVLALAIKFLLGALQSGTFNALLKKFSLPPIPTAVFPWAGVVLGLAAGVVQGLQAGDALPQAIAAALSSALAGGVSAMHLQFVSGREPVVGGAPPPQMGVVTLTPAQVSAIKSAPPPPTVARRWGGSLAGFAVVALVLGIVLFPRGKPDVATSASASHEPVAIAAPVMAEGCAWWEKNEPTIVQYSEADAACVLGQLFTTGAFSPAAIVLACAPVTLVQVIAILDNLVNFYVFPDAGAPVSSDGGIAMTGLHCGYGEPTVKGAPACVTHETLLRIMAVQSAAHAEAAAQK